MDLQVCAIIAVVFLVSLFTILIINRKLSGKTFEDVLAEKRQLADKVYGSSHVKHQKKLNRKVNKKSKERKPKDKKEKDTEPESQNDSDADSLSATSNNSPVHQKGHVEFSEAEIIPEDPIPAKKQGAAKRNQNRKNSNSKTTGGILSHKNDQNVSPTTAPVAAVEPSPASEPLNHFEEILPKDEFELKKHKEESTENVIKGNKKDAKKGKGKKETHPSPKLETVTHTAQASPAAVQTIVSDVQTTRKETPSPAAVAQPQPTVPITAAFANEVVPVQKDSPKSLATKEKLNKKKKNELISNQSRQMNFEQIDGMGVNTIVSLLAKAELTRSEIQLLIDYLLNKQQDNTSNHSEWSDDIVQKLKRQLAEKEKALIDEQETAAGFQAKLREMRMEINTERAQNQYKLNAFVEELNAKKMENQNLTQEIQFINDKYTNEKQTLTNQLQQIQTKLYLDKQNVNQEQIQKLQQLTDANQLLTNENFSKTHMINDMQEKFNLSAKTIGELEQKLRDYEMILRQSENEIGVLKNEMQRLHGDNVRKIADKDEYEKIIQMQKYDLEQLRAQIAEQNAKSNHLDDSSKVEIRNLQNALDSSNTELQLGRGDLVKSKELVDELTAQVSDLKSTIDAHNSNSMKQGNQIDELTSALSNYKKIVTEKDSKITDYQNQLQNVAGKEDELFKKINEYKDKNNKFLEKLNDNNGDVSSSKQITAAINEEQTRTKEILERLFPDASAGPDSYQEWIEHIAAHIEQYIANNNNLINNTKQLNYNNSSAYNNSESNSTNHINSSENNTSDTKTTASSSSTEDLILQNAKLQTTVDQYKTIVADTDALLKNVEKQAAERDAYWKNILELKDKEIQSIKADISVDNV